MTYSTVPILPGRVPSRMGEVNMKELERLQRVPRKKNFSLDRTQIRILVDVVFPYWKNYLKVIVHPVQSAGISKLRFAWADFPPTEDRRVVRTALVAMEVWTSIDLLPERVVILVELCSRNVPHRCVIMHEGRGRYEIPLPDQECDGLPH